MPKNLSSSLLGAAGEHLVLSRLLTRGVLASAAPPGFEKIDILVQPLGKGGPQSVQVKATFSSEKVGWWLSDKHEKITDPGLIYCFVTFSPTSQVVYVIPAPVVAKAITIDHRGWLSRPGARGEARKDTAGRKLRASMFDWPENWLEKYRENWDCFL
jgi:hypothetical protein